MTESLWLDIDTDSGILLLGVCYRPELAGNNYIENLTRCINSLPHDKTIVITGDFNFRDICWQTNSATSAISNVFLNCVNDNYLCQLVEKPTRINYINDLIFTNDISIVQSCDVLNNFSTSDHKIISVSLSLNPRHIVKNTRTVFLYSKGDYINFQSEANSLNWDNILSANNIETNWATFKAKYNYLVCRYIPRKTLKSGMFYRAPWANNRMLKKERKKRRTAQIQYKQSGMFIDKLLYDNQCDTYEKAVVTAKCSYEAMLATKISDNPRRFYNYTKNFTKSTCSIDCIIKDGVKYTQGKDMANILSEHFISVMTSDSSPSPPINREVEGEISTIVFDENDIANLLINMKPFKAIGPDGIHPYVLHEIIAFAKPLLILYKQSLSTGLIPQDWLDANICAIHKKGSKTDPNNYRPVSLTSHVAKLFERLLLYDLLEYCEQFGILHCNQHGFQAGKSCLTNLLDCFNDWTSTYDKSRPLVGTDIIYTDFAKAFDTVQHSRLLSKIESYGIKGDLLAWIKQFLLHRRQRVVLHGAPSNWQDVISGVPQGTITGPILFLLFINDLPDVVHCTAKLFADDAKIYSDISNINDCLALQSDLDALSQWSKDWLINFNKEKCVVLRIRKAIEFDYFIENHKLSEVSVQTDLGIIVSNDLKPSTHIDHITKKANQRLGMIRRCFTNHTSSVINPLYKAIVRPIIEHNSQLWNPWLVKDINNLDKVQKRCIKLCTSQISFEPLSDRRRKADLCEVYKQLRSPTANTPLIRSTSNTRGNALKLDHQLKRTDVRKYYFSNRVIADWNSLSTATVLSPNVSTFKDRIELTADW